MPILSLIIPFIYIFNFQSNNLYKLNIFLTRADQLVNIIKSFLFGTIVLVIFLFLLNFPNNLNSRYFLFIYTITSLILVSFIRLFVVKPLYEKLKDTKAINSNVIIIGAGKSAKMLATKLIVENQVGINILGFADDNILPGTEIIKGLKVVDSINNVANLNGKLKVDEAIISIDNITYDRLLEIIELYNSKNFIVKVNSELFKTIPENLVVEKYSGIDVINTSPQIDIKHTLIFKQIFDRIVALLALICLLPFFLIVALIIKLTSKGPVFYKQVRIGKDGKPFKFLKFRSMYINNNGEEDPKRVEMMIKFMKEDKAPEPDSTKVVDNKRITPIGKFLRKYSLDELPQLINVLKGEMSLVGPRPCLPYEYENYEEWQKKRVSVIPGCTGVWQVYGRSKVNFRDSVIMDLYYINNMSPWLDLQLIFKTIPVILFGKGGK
jgi:undecaprenyl-phosphate galactose phosphotransferase